MAGLITVDLDFPTRLEIVQAWYYLKRHDPHPEGPQGRLSASRGGVHVRSRPVLPAEVPVNEHHRRMAGDDVRRLEADASNGWQENQVLWSYKRGLRAGAWTDSLDQLVSQYRAQTMLPPEVLRDV